MFGSDDTFMNLYQHWNNIDREHENKRQSFMRLMAEPCMKPAKVNDRVIVATGFLGMGFEWERRECLVVETGDTSVKVRFTGDTYRPDREQWIHPALITDNLGQAEIGETLPEGD